MKRFLITVAATIAVLTASASAAVACDSPSHGGYQHWNPPTWHQPAPCPPSPPVVVTPPAPPVVTPPVVIVTQTVIVIAPAGPTGATGATGAPGPSAPTVTAPASDTLTAPALVKEPSGPVLTIKPNDTWAHGRIIHFTDQVSGPGAANAVIEWWRLVHEGNQWVSTTTGYAPKSHKFIVPKGQAYKVRAVNGPAYSVSYTQQ